MTTTGLKLVAVVFMLMDHIGKYIQGTPLILRWIGRLSAPIFLFCTMWGFYYTHDRKLYIRRLYFLSLLMGILRFVLNNFLFIEKKYQSIDINIFHSLFEVVLFLYLIELRKKDINSKKNFILYFLWQAISCSCFMLCTYNYWHDSFIEDIVSPMVGSVFSMEGGLVFFIMGIIIYFFKSNPIRLSIIYSSYILLLNIISISNIIPRIRLIIQHVEVVNDIYIIFFEKIIKMNSIGLIEPSLLNLFTFDYQWMMIAALPFMLLFNQQKGKGYKYFFYIFYPLHITILYMIGNVMIYM